MPSTQRSFLASCLRYLTPVFPLPVPAHSSQAEGPAVRSLPHSRTLTSHTGKGREKQGRGRYVPSRHQGVRREARTGALQEQGTYRLDPLNLTQNKKPPTAK